MKEIQKMNSALLKAQFRDVLDSVENHKQPLIVQRYGRDAVALVPLETLALIEKAKSKGK